MSDSTLVEDLSIIHDTVMSTQEAVAEVLGSLIDATDAEGFSIARTEIHEYLENISVVADMCNLKGLSALCNQLTIQLKNFPLSNKNEAEKLNEQLNVWLFDILTYLDDSRSKENITLITSSLLDHSDDIQKLLLLDIQKNSNHSDLAEIDEEVSEDGNDINPDSPEGIMELFCQELQYLQPQINQLTQQIIGDNNNDAISATNQYEEIIERIRLTCDELNLAGIVQVCEFVIKNIHLSLNLDNQKRIDIKDVLIGWPQVIINHLQAPSDDKLCLEVLNYLEINSWPEPLKYSETRQLIDGLTKELELTGDYEVEERSKIATPEDVSLIISSDASQQLHDAFFTESPAHAEELAMLISEIIQGNDVLKNIKAAQRVSHTLKGSANLIGTSGIANLSHHLEDIFEYLLKQSLTPPEPLAYTMQEAADTIEIMIESLQGLVSPPTDAQRILQDVLNWANQIDQGKFNNEEINNSGELDNKFESSIELTPETETNITNDFALKSPQDEIKVPAQNDMLRVPRDTIDQIFNLIGETSIAIGQIQEQLKRMHERGDEMRKQEKTLQARRFELENLVSIRGMAHQQKRQHAANNDGDFDSLEMDRYDEFYGATHTFIESVSDTREASRDVNAHIIELDGLFLKQQRLNRTLQDLVLTTRMVPINTISARLQRTVRQACRATSKQAELKIEGDALLIDGDVLNQIADPLMHLLRNAIDHGIEPSASRVQQNKTSKGNIVLHFYQQGNNIKVDCSDDGGGLDYDQIRWTAIERNLISPQDEIKKSELARMILNSGFSTRDETTQISGRGVGMDVVYTAITSLKGQLDIQDNETCGTRFSLSLPITLLTSHSILVQTEDNRYAIPTSMLDQILPPGTGQYNKLNGKTTYQLGKDIYPAKSLSELLGLADTNEVLDDNKKTVLLVHHDTEIYAVTVDYVVSSYDLVIKSLGRYVKSVSGITGVALLGDGGVVPVLDMLGLLKLQTSSTNKLNRSSTHTRNKKLQLAKVMIVDDSLSVRKSLSQLVQDAGYDPIVVRDGIEALEVMQKTTPDLILTDLEMPRMNGLELATHVRSTPATEKLPIMMITSRTMNKHQEQAQKAGINEYITKPFSEDELVEKLGIALHG